MKGKITKGEATRQRIVSEARSLFERHGHFRVTLPEIARKAGISHSTLYLYFSDREELLMEVAREAARQGRSTVDSHIDLKDPALERLSGVVRGNLRMAYDPERRWQLGHLLSLYYFCAFDPKLLEAFREIESGAVDRLETILVHGEREGSWSLDGAQARHQARALHDLLFGETMKAFVDPGELGEKERVRRTWAAVLRFLSVKS